MNNTYVKVVEGNELKNTVPEAAKIAGTSTSNTRTVNIPFDGTNGNNQMDRFILSEKLLSQHLLLVGGIGSGKTNTFNHILRSLIPQMTEKDVMIIFDTKGDFLKEFHRQGDPRDVIISNDKTASGYWNIFKELELSNQLMEDCIELSTSLFQNKIENSGSNSFFPQAAKDLLTAILYHFASINGASNATISAHIKGNSVDWYRALLSQESSFRALNNYIPADAPGQALGVLAELQQIVRELFIGNFAKNGNISIRNLVRSKGAKKIFIEYDIGIGGMLGPIYSILFDLAIKEALCRDKSEGNVYFVCDEFKLLPNLKHIDDAVNFGRSLGIKFMIGIQNTDQIITSYHNNEHMAKNIFSGFLNQFAFRVSDYSTRKYIKERAGENRKCTTLKTVQVQDTISTANVVEDWDIANLKVGEAIVMLNGVEPFKFRFKEYK